MDSSSNNNNTTDPPQPTEDNSELIFELRATLAAVQAEASHRVDNAEGRAQQQWQDTVRRLELEVKQTKAQLQQVVRATRSSVSNQQQQSLKEEEQQQQSLNEPSNREVVRVTNDHKTTVSTTLAQHLLDPTLAFQEPIPRNILMQRVNNTCNHDAILLEEFLWSTNPTKDEHALEWLYRILLASPTNIQWWKQSLQNTTTTTTTTGSTLIQQQLVQEWTQQLWQCVFARKKIQDATRAARILQLLQLTSPNIPWYTVSETLLPNHSVRRLPVHKHETHHHLPETQDHTLQWLIATLPLCQNHSRDTLAAVLNLWETHIEHWKDHSLELATECLAFCLRVTPVALLATPMHTNTATQYPHTAPSALTVVTKFFHGIVLRQTENMASTHPELDPLRDACVRVVDRVGKNMDRLWTSAASLCLQSLHPPQPTIAQMLRNQIELWLEEQERLVKEEQ